jgi:hypothetical protein
MIKVLIAEDNAVNRELLRNGDGTFQAAKLYDSGGLYATSIAAGDAKSQLPNAMIHGQSIGQAATPFLLCAPVPR